MWTLSSTPTWENENFIIAIIITIIIIIKIVIAIIIIIIIFVVVVVGDNTYYGVTCPPAVHFKFITKCYKCYYEVRQNKVSVLKRFTESDCWAAGRCPCGISSCVAWIPNNRQITFRGNYNRKQTRAISPYRSTTSYLLE